MDMYSNLNFDYTIKLILFYQTNFYECITAYELTINSLVTGSTVNSTKTSEGSSNSSSSSRSNYESARKMIGIIEDAFGCSGICRYRDLYLFSDVGKGQPIV